MDNKDVQFDELFQGAAQGLREFFQSGGDITEKELARARICSTVVSAWSRYEQTKRAKEATQFMMARELATNRDQLAAYVRISMPEASIIKALPQPLKETRCIV